MCISSKLENIELKKYDLPLATVLGVGKIKYAPGTFGSLAALFTLFINDDFYFIIIGIIALVLFFVSLPVINRIEKIKGSDPGFIVIDEFVGMAIVLLNPFVPHNFIWVAIGFGLFRFFDIIKPFPINKINNQNGGFFVMFDDVVAGLFSAILAILFFSAYQILPFFILFCKKN